MGWEERAEAGRRSETNAQMSFCRSTSQRINYLHSWQTRCRNADLGGTSIAETDVFLLTTKIHTCNSTTRNKQLSMTLQVCKTPMGSVFGSFDLKPHLKWRHAVYHAPMAQDNLLKKLSWGLWRSSGFLFERVSSNVLVGDKCEFFRSSFMEPWSSPSCLNKLGEPSGRDHGIGSEIYW